MIIETTPSLYMLKYRVFENELVPGTDGNSHAICSSYNIRASEGCNETAMPAKGFALIGDFVQEVEGQVEEP